MPYRRCGESIFFLNLSDPGERDYTVSREFVSPFYGVIRERAKERRRGWAGFGTLTVRLAYPENEDVLRAMDILRDPEERQAYKRWTEILMQSGPSNVDEGIAIAMDAFMGLPETEQDRILRAMTAILDEEKRSSRMARYTGEPPEFEFPVKEEDIAFVEAESDAHMAFLEALEVMEGPEKEAYLQEGRELLKSARYAVYEGEARFTTGFDLDAMMVWANMKDAQIAPNLQEALNTMLASVGIENC